MSVSDSLPIGAWLTAALPPNDARWMRPLSDALDPPRKEASKALQKRLFTWARLDAHARPNVYDDELRRVFGPKVRGKPERARSELAEVVGAFLASSRALPVMVETDDALAVRIVLPNENDPEVAAIVNQAIADLAAPSVRFHLCVVCWKVFRPVRTDARFCSPHCKARHSYVLHHGGAA